MCTCMRQLTPNQSVASIQAINGTFREWKWWTGNSIQRNLLKMIIINYWNGSLWLTQQVGSARSLPKSAWTLLTNVWRQDGGFSAAFDYDSITLAPTHMTFSLYLSFSPSYSRYKTAASGCNPERLHCSWHYCCCTTLFSSRRWQQLSRSCTAPRHLSEKDNLKTAFAAWASMVSVKQRIHSSRFS